MVICLEQGADLHMAQLMPLPLTISCSSKIQIGFTFLVPADLGTPRKRAVKRTWLTNCSDPSGPVNPVNSCIFVAVLYFPVFRLCPVFSCILFITVLGCVYSFTLEVQCVFSIKRYFHQLVPVDCS